MEEGGRFDWLIRLGVSLIRVNLWNSLTISEKSYILDFRLCFEYASRFVLFFFTFAECTWGESSNKTTRLQMAHTLYSQPFCRDPYHFPIYLNTFRKFAEHLFYRSVFLQNQYKSLTRTNQNFCRNRNLY